MTVNDSVLNETFFNLRSLSVAKVIYNNCILNWSSNDRSNNLFLWKSSYYLRWNIIRILINNLLNHSALLELNLLLRLNLLVDNNWWLNFTCWEEIIFSIFTETWCRTSNHLILILLSTSLYHWLFSSESCIIISLTKLDNISNGITIQIACTVSLLLSWSTHHKFRIMVSDCSL